MLDVFEAVCFFRSILLCTSVTWTFGRHLRDYSNAKSSKSKGMERH